MASLERDAVWQVDESDRRAFAELSGDHNPIHVDPIASRRFPFGRVAVHGMQLLLDTLDRIVVATGGTPRRVRCTFRHSVAIGQPIRTELDTSQPGVVRARIGVDVWTAADITVELGEAFPSTEYELSAPPDDAPDLHDIEALRDRVGSIDVRLGQRAFDEFPHLTAAIGRTALAELVSLTRLVGMHVPGEFSLDSSLDVTLGSAGGEPGGLGYRVVSADERFALVTIAVEAGSLAGTVKAFVRARPVVQHPDGSMPSGGEFAGQRWLVVGGSRGLGSMAVLLLAAGGADVRFTYRLGDADADDVASRAPGSRPFRFDVERPDELTGVLADGWRPTHLAHMATPPMSDGVRGAFSEALERQFHAVYVVAFTRLVETLASDGLQAVLWPSTTLIGAGAPDMAEFVSAKTAGESACAGLADRHPHLRVVAHRFPRLLTDQTASFVPVEYGDTTAEVLTALRRTRA